MRGIDRTLRPELGVGGRQTHRDISTPTGIVRVPVTHEEEEVTETLREKLNQEVQEEYFDHETTYDQIRQEVADELGCDVSEID